MGSQGDRVCTQRGGPTTRILGFDQDFAPRAASLLQARAEPPANSGLIDLV